MTRVARAAKTLVDQILERWEDAQISNHGEPDGFDVVRSIRVEEPVGAELYQILEPIQQHDRRLVGLMLQEDGSLVVEISPRHFGDQTDPFPLGEVEAVLTASEPDEKAAVADEQPKGDAKPAPAKKAAQKRKDA